MKKLNKRKIRWIIKEIDKRNIGVYTISKLQNITQQHARYVHRKYKNVKDPVLLKPGRKPKPISSEDRELIINMYKEYLVGATMVEMILDEKGMHVSHNRIHDILSTIKGGVSSEG